ncbi:MAG TPA: 30S ribosome-binding factor RbfA [Phycisphaerae bacterium]|nr:30S ribosome-binding factor RbfA [Phycisphaerae bacterium]
MSRRTQRVANWIRQILGEALLSRLSDPRIDPVRTSVTRVEIPEDLLTAKVFVSVLGTEAQERRALRALQHAAGHLQELMMRRMSLRHTPILSFELDTRYKKTLETLGLIQQAMDEIHEKEQSRQDLPEPPAGVDEPSQEDRPVRETDSNP